MMDHEVNNGAAAPFATADSVGDGPQYVSTYGNDSMAYGAMDNIWNWMTGDRSRRERDADITNQRISALWNSQEASKNRAFEEYMSNTAISRAIADAERNGINKYYISSNGLTASTPSGSSASSSYSPLTSSVSKSGSGFLQFVGTIAAAFMAMYGHAAGIKATTAATAANNAVKAEVAKISAAAKIKAARIYKGLEK